MPRLWSFWEGWRGVVLRPPDFTALQRQGGCGAATHALRTLVGSVSPDSAARDAGLRAGDVVTAVDGEPVFAFRQVAEAVEASDGQPVTLALWRDGEEVEATVTPRRTDVPARDGWGSAIASTVVVR